MPVTTYFISHNSHKKKPFNNYEKKRARLFRRPVLPGASVRQPLPVKRLFKLGPIQMIKSSIIMTETIYQKNIARLFALLDATAAAITAAAAHGGASHASGLIRAAIWHALVLRFVVDGELIIDVVGRSTVKF